MQLHTKRMTLLASLSAIGILLGYLESFIVLPIRIPGIKLGLSNCITIIAIYLFGPVEGLIVLFVRVLLSGLLFGSLFSLIYSLSGALLSFVIMVAIYRNSRISCIGVSVVGGVSHNIAQLIAASVLLESGEIFVYLPVLIIAGVFAGFVVGIISKYLINRINNFF